MTVTLQDLKPSQIKPHKNNPRRDVGDVTELAASITEQGILEPLIVAPNGAPDAYQALTEKDWPALRHALVMVGAEVVLWIQHGDRRGDLPVDLWPHPPTVVEPARCTHNMHIDERLCCACDCPRCTTRDAAGDIDACICPDCIGNPTCGIHARTGA